MPSSDSLKSDIAALSKKEFELHKDLAKHQSDANKHAAESSKKALAALKTKSDSMARSYGIQSTAAAKKAAAAEGEVAKVKGKIADIQTKKAAKSKSLTSAEASERREAERQRQRDRQSDVSHVRDLARLTAGVRVVAIKAPKPEKLRILYLTANPEAVETSVTSVGGKTVTQSAWLRTEAEFDMVQQQLRGSKYRDRVEIAYLPAATHARLLQGMNDHRPHIIHFSGHGGSRGVQFDNGDVASPQGVGMSYDQLAQFLAATDEPPKLLVLNACDTLDGAEILLPAVPVVIAMSDSITDLAAAGFASTFYAAIASAQSVEKALAQAKAVLAMMPSSEAHLPECITRDGLDASELVLVEVPLD